MDYSDYYCPSDLDIHTKTITEHPTARQMINCYTALTESRTKTSPLCRNDTCKRGTWHTVYIRFCQRKCQDMTSWILIQKLLTKMHFMKSFVLMYVHVCLYSENQQQRSWCIAYWYIWQRKMAYILLMMNFSWQKCSCIIFFVKLPLVVCKWILAVSISFLANFALVFLSLIAGVIFIPLCLATLPSPTLHCSTVVVYLYHIFIVVVTLLS